MGLLDHFKSLKTPEIRLAWIVAIAADTIQIAALPLFAEGAISPADTVLDLVVGATLVRLLGWHWAFLPTLAAELLPGFDLFPTWTAAVWYVSRQLTAEATGTMDSGRKVGDVEILPPEPGSARRGFPR
jgi:hypothetical protein